MKKTLCLFFVGFALLGCSKDVVVDELSTPAETKATIVVQDWTVDMIASLPNGWFDIPDTTATYTLGISKPYRIIKDANGNNITKYATGGLIELAIGMSSPSGGMDPMPSYGSVSQDTISYKGGYIYMTFRGNDSNSQRGAYVMASYNGVITSKMFLQRPRQPYATTFTINGGSSLHDI